MLKKIDIFGGLKMTWPIVCIFATVIGVYVGTVNQIPFLNNTSFQDIAVSFEWWVLFALTVITNCKTAREAATKCLVFFLISQPVIYLTELHSIGIDKALYYYFRIWLPISLLTFPGGAVAFYSKKQNAFGAIILGIGNAVVTLTGTSYFKDLCNAFPHHLLTVVFCVLIVIATIFGIQKNRKTRLLSLITTLLITGGVIIWAVLTKRVI